MRARRSRSRSRALTAGTIFAASAAAATTVTFVPNRAHAAEPPPARAEGIMSPGRTAASEESVESVALNPANLGYLPAAELRWTGVRCPEGAKVGCGHAFTLGTPLLWGFGTALRVDYVTPPWTVGFPFSGFDYTWITWGLGVRLSDALAFGMSIQRAYSGNAYTNGLFGITAGLTYRPNTHFAFAAVAHDFNRPSAEILPISNAPVLDRSYVLGMAFRPTGTRALEFGLEARYLEGNDQWLPRGVAQLDIPHLGRLRADIEVAHLPNDGNRSIIGSAGLEVYLGGASLGGGVFAGSGLGSNSSVGFYGMASISGYVNPGWPRGQRAVTIRMEATPGTRTHVALLRRLWKISEDRDIRAVTFIMRAEPASTLAHAEELSDAIRVLRARGKKVLCSWEDAGAKALYACANADRIVLNPAGGLRYSGLKSQYFYLAGLLDKVGIKAEFVRIGAHKSAPEQFMNQGASDVSKADHEDFLRETEAVFVKDVSQGRKLTEDQVRASTLKGPFVAGEARDAHFIDAFAFDDEIERATQDLVGYPIPVEKYEDDVEAPTTFGPRARVAILYIDGDIVDGRSSNIPILDMKLVGSYSIAETVKAVREDPSIKAVVLRIESPGGSSMASDVMWRELSLLNERKPLIVSMGSVAASGGYYVASPARTIYALPLTLTGSIGIFYGKADASQLLHKIGVNVETYKTTPRADAESLFRGFTDDERHELQHKIQQFYDVFLDRVAKGRHLTKEQVDAVGQGRVWTGQEALDHHLVDKLGGMREALDAARAAGGLPADAPIVELPHIEKSLIERALDLAGIHASATLGIDGLPVQIRDVARAIAPMAIYSGDIPLARLESVPLEDLEGVDPE